MLTLQRIDELVRKYADGPALLEAAVSEIPEEELHFSPGPEHWSIHENVVHVADAELVHAVRIRFVIAQPGATLVAFDQTQWARALRYSAHSRHDSLRLFRAICETTTDLLRRVPPEAWAQAGIHTEAGPQTLEQLVEDYADHVPYHLRTIAKRRRQYAEARAHASIRRTS